MVQYNKLQQAVCILSAYKTGSVMEQSSPLGHGDFTWSWLGFSSNSFQNYHFVFLPGVLLGSSNNSDSAAFPAYQASSL